MAITLKRQLTPEEKGTILARHGRICFATGHAIPEGEALHFDHVRAFALGGQSEVDNIAPMCEHHNKSKGTLPLEDFRTKLRLQEFFNAGDRLTLKNLLSHLQDKQEISRFGDLVVTSVTPERVSVESNSVKLDSKLHTCAITGWQYFYAPIPVEILNSDDDEDH